MTRQPLVLMGSLVTWTGRVWPFLRMSWMFGSGAAGRDLALPGLRRCWDALGGGGAAVAAPRRRRSRPRQPPFRSPGASSAGGLGQRSDAVGGLGLRRLAPRLLVDRILVLVRLEQVGGVEERALLLTDVDEGGLDTGQHRLDPAEVDVTDRAPVVGAVDQQLDQTVVFQDGHAGFPLAPVDQDLALQVMTSAAAGASTTRSAAGRRSTLGMKRLASRRTRRLGACPIRNTREPARPARQYLRQLYVAIGA